RDGARLPVTAWASVGLDTPDALAQSPSSICADRASRGRGTIGRPDLLIRIAARAATPTGSDGLRNLRDLVRSPEEGSRFPIGSPASPYCTSPGGTPSGRGCTSGGGEDDGAEERPLRRGCGGRPPKRRAAPPSCLDNLPARRTS